MPRINKKTRIKGLPPKVQLQQRDAITGSFPSNARVASDNRTGNYGVSYDDRNTIGFGYSQNILDNVISYWRFNSGSGEEVVPINLSSPSASYKVYPTFLGKSLDNIYFDRSLTYRGAQPPDPGAPHFDTVTKPFTGPTDDTNSTSMDFYPPDGTMCSGSILLFNPASETVISGSEKSFTISFWARVAGTTPSVQYMVALAQPTATQSLGSITTGSILNLQRVASSDQLRIMLIDPNNNGIGKNLNTVMGSGWHHYAITYDGSKSFTGITFYRNGVIQTNTLNLFQGTLNAYVGMTSSINAHSIYFGTLANLSGTTYDGWMDEVAFFDRVLDSGEIKEIASFQRSLNKPKQNPLTGIYYGLGLGTSSSFIKTPTEQTSSLFGFGKVIKGIGDSAATFTPGQDLTPFQENDNPALDGLSSTSSFYAEGSPVSVVGEGFNQPLWSKTKIEIDITPRTQCTFGVRASGSLTDPSHQDNFFMAYWNHVAKVWQGIGNGAPLNKYEGHSTASTPQKLFLMFSELCNGFGSTIDSGGFSSALTASSTVVGNPINNFGFPFDAKYKATSSNYINISDYINGPFLVEKIVLLTSGTLDFRDSGAAMGGTANSTEPAITTFFLLNQRPASPTKAESTIYWASGSSTIQTLVTRSLTANSSRDLISWLQISKIVQSGPAAYRAGFSRDFNYTRINSRVHFNRQFSITSSVKTPVQYDMGVYNIGDTPSTTPDNRAGQYFETWNRSGRNNTNDFGRNYLNVFIQPERFGSMGFGGTNAWITAEVQSNKQYAKVNPYILMPGDQLILGWNLPSGQRAFIRRPTNLYMLGQSTSSPNQLGPSLTFGPSGTHKLIIYGSQIRNQKEFHDTLNQLLTSNSVHEVIE